MTKLTVVLLVETLVGGLVLWDALHHPVLMYTPMVFIAIFVVLGVTLMISAAGPAHKGKISGSLMLITVLGLITALLGFLAWYQGQLF